MDHKENFKAATYTDWLRHRQQKDDDYKDHKQDVANRRRGGYDDPVVKGEKRAASYIHQVNECITTLAEQELLPALFFSFSRKSCETLANKVQGSLLSGSEAASVKHIIDFHLHHYPEVYNATKQFFTISELLMRGVAFHHSGLLPLLKEIIEILFAKGLVKVLFATETFAVGINMPTKTVVFTGYEKYDDSSNGMRTLYTDEYIQMAGRAGRRGKDKEGLVLYLPEREPLSVTEIQRMMTDAERHAQGDRARKELIELRNNAEGLIYTTDEALRNYGDILSPLDVEEIRNDIETLRASMNTVDPEELRLATQNLEQSAYRISDAMYADAAERKSKG
jgi:superfamily II RNA helicase